MLNLETQYIHIFDRPVDSISLPEKFTFPFYYSPHILIELASEQLQNYLSHQNEWQHNFGLDPSKEGLVISKMFGVMVVQNENRDLRFLAAYSGKLASTYHIKGFVPPIFDMLEETGFYKVEEREISKLNQQIETIESDLLYQKVLQELDDIKSKSATTLEIAKKEFSHSRKERRGLRKHAKTNLSENDYAELHNRHRSESYQQQNYIRNLILKIEQEIADKQIKANLYIDKIEALKEERKRRSNKLQNKLFDQYNFLNAKGEQKSIIEIFRDTVSGLPPAGAGDCAAPKLLQFAFENNLTPICMGEFWWGQSSKSEVRKHKYFYPSCRGKCEPILSHMLQGIEVDDNPMLENMAEGKTIEVLHEDDEIVVINKPYEFLSVPGKSVSDSVYLRMRQKYPDATGPLIVHRLDMSTSGILVIAKSMLSYKNLQQQFIRRKVSKRYVAILDGKLEFPEGEIRLPLRVDLNDRPRQLVCEEHGKMAHTRYKTIEKLGDRTKVHFYPITGRTHQLRVHAAHAMGLNTPILGDDLYGKLSDRLFLHANYIKFKHPTSGELIEIKCRDNFDRFTN